MTKVYDLELKQHIQWGFVNLCRLGGFVAFISFETKAPRLGAKLILCNNRIMPC